MQILSGDIGGTNTRLALFEWHETGFETLLERSFLSAEHPSLDAILRAFLDEARQPPPAVAAFGLAGPVRGRQCAITNLPWLVDADRMEADLGIADVALLNDLEATAWGVPTLSAGDLLTLQEGAAEPQGNQMVIAAGTGLGQAGICRGNGGFLPYATEGGHTSFAPADDREFRLLRYLQGEYGHVSWERLLSGPGIVNLYRFLRDEEGHRESPLLEEADPAAAIARASEEGDEDAHRAMHWFTCLYGAEAGNQALKQMATGGVFVGGGIAPKILEWMQRPPFLRAFRNKGRMQPLMEAMPVQVILNDRAGLYGPAYYQWRRHSRSGAPTTQD